jgi:hypothetical protein
MPHLPILLPPRQHLLRLNPKLIARFKRKIEFGDFRTNACWRWIGAAIPNRLRPLYGVIGVRVPGRPGVTVVKAHRVAVVLQDGRLRPDLDVTHICLNGICVNPTHLLPMGHAGHMRADRIARGIRRDRPPNWLIPHRMLAEVWGLPEYNAIAEQNIREQPCAAEEQRTELVYKPDRLHVQTARNAETQKPKCTDKTANRVKTSNNDSL